MRNIINRAFGALTAICIALLISVLFSFGKDVTERRLLNGYQVLEDSEYTRVADVQAPIGYREEYIFSFDVIDGGYRDLFFYTEHRNVDVYVDGERVYHLRPFINNSFGNTPGCIWNEVALEDEEAGKTIRIVCTPLYESVKTETPLFYFGEKYDIGMSVLLKQLPTLILCMVGILAGLLYVAYALYNYKKYDVDIGLLMLGILSMIVSLWKLTDNMAMYMIFSEMEGLYVAPLIFVQLGIIPFILFAKELNGGGDEKIWYAPVWLSLAATTLIVFLQVLEACDMRNMLWLVYAEWFLATIITLWMLCYRVYKRGLDSKRRRDLLLLILCMLVMVADTGVGALSSDSSFVGMLGFVAYVLLMGAFTVKDAKELMAIGIQAKNFEKKAYHDQLTGLYNRTAYADYISQEIFALDKAIVAVFDLNNLKKYNDALGHERGDQYIQECANLILSAFGEVGRCYRMGGDEFSVLMEHTSLEECKKRIRTLKNSVEERNKQHPDMVMGIACGYELYDKRLDHDINDTARRADKMMYKEKYAMKQAQ